MSATDPRPTADPTVKTELTSAHPHERPSDQKDFRVHIGSPQSAGAGQETGQGTSAFTVVSMHPQLLLAQR
jgi:hypothetical protein